MDTVHSWSKLCSKHFFSISVYEKIIFTGVENFIQNIYPFWYLLGRVKRKISLHTTFIIVLIGVGALQTYFSGGLQNEKRFLKKYMLYQKPTKEKAFN